MNMNYVLLAGRILFGFIFVCSGFCHFLPTTIHYAISKGVIIPMFLVPFSGIIAILGGLSIILGYRARWGAWLIVLFLVPVTFTMHRFWDAVDPMAVMLQRIMFMKNLSMLGGALIIAYFGSGPMSLSKK